MPSFFQIFLSLFALIWAFLQSLSNPRKDLAQSFVLGIEASIAMSMASARESTILSSSLAVFDDKDDILARFFCKVFISKMLFIFTSRRLESASLSIICNVYSDKIGWWSGLWSKSFAILQ